MKHLVLVYPILALALVYLPKYVAFIPLLKMGYDNRHPREQQQKLEGWGKRAIAAHQNGFESFPAFAAAILMAYVTQVNETHVHALGITHVIARTLYVFFYLGNVHVMRSIVWTIGLFCSVGLMVLAVIG